MTLLIDANILLDVLMNRKEFKNLTLLNKSATSIA